MIHDFDGFIGKRITVNPDKIDLDKFGLYDLDWFYDIAEDPDGDCRLIIEDHDPDEDDEDEEEYSCGYTILMGIDFEFENYCISSITPFAEPVGDDGLGDCDPEDEWGAEIYDKATRFLELITAEQSDEK